MSPFYSRGPIDLGSRIHLLPIGGAVPRLAEWQWLPTSGHAPVMCRYSEKAIAR